MAKKKRSTPKKTGKPATSAQGAASEALAAVRDLLGAEPIIYATGNRQPVKLFGTQIASDVLPLLGQHLDQIGQVERIALVLHTMGGSLDAPWPFVNMLWRHAKELLVVVPVRALSAGTLMALGAKRIVMGPHAFLSPVDPIRSVGAEKESGSIQVEDVLGYVDFVCDRVGIRDQEALVQALKDLTSEVKPTVLGSIHRTRLLIERLSRNLLELHMKQSSDRARVDKIVDFLTHSLFTHQHLIPPGEAKAVIGLPVEELSFEAAAQLSKVGDFIKEQLQEDEPLDASGFKPDKPAQEFTSVRALLVSEKIRHGFRCRYRANVAQDGEVQVRPIIASWQRLS